MAHNLHQRLANRIDLLSTSAKEEPLTFEVPEVQKAITQLSNAVLICTINQLQVDGRPPAHEKLDFVRSFLICVGSKIPENYVLGIAKCLERLENVWLESRALQLAGTTKRRNTLFPSSDS